MVVELSFPHHTYQNALDDGEHQFIGADEAQGVLDPTSVDLAGERQALRDAHVRRIILIHGTFAGNDIIGVMRELERILPHAADSLRELGKRLFDQSMGQVGNYTESFVQTLSQILNPDEDEPIIDVRRHLWSGENHHVGRASGAINLLDGLLQESWEPKDRVLVWAHSHGGNLMALLSNLLGSNSQAIETFFQATHSHYHDPLLHKTDLPAWDRSRTRLLAGDVRTSLPAIDVVTFGTPPRYRWDTTACPHLLHFVQHRSLDAAHPLKAVLPRSIRELSTAAGGDYLQHMGIGGTDFLHSMLAWRSWCAERRLRRILEPGTRRRDLPSHLKRGYRLQLEGKTYLVDYPEEPGKWNQALLGHGIYTRAEWIPFHLRQIIASLYA